MKRTKVGRNIEEELTEQLHVRCQIHLFRHQREKGKMENPSHQSSQSEKRLCYLQCCPINQNKVILFFFLQKTYLNKLVFHSPCINNKGKTWIMVEEMKKRFALKRRQKNNWTREKKVKGEGKWIGNSGRGRTICGTPTGQFSGKR